MFKSYNIIVHLINPCEEVHDEVNEFKYEIFLEHSVFEWVGERDIPLHVQIIMRIAKRENYRTIVQCLLCMHGVPRVNNFTHNQGFI